MEVEAEIQVREKIAQMDIEIKEINRRATNLENLVDSVHSIALEMKEMRADMRTVSSDVKDISRRVDEVEQRPKKKYDAFVVAVIAALASGRVTYFLTVLLSTPK